MDVTAAAPTPIFVVQVSSGGAGGQTAPQLLRPPPRADRVGGAAVRRASTAIEATEIAFEASHITSLTRRRGEVPVGYKGRAGVTVAIVASSAAVPQRMTRFA